MEATWLCMLAVSLGWTRVSTAAYAGPPPSMTVHYSPPASPSPSSLQYVVASPSSASSHLASPLVKMRNFAPPTRRLRVKPPPYVQTSVYPPNSRRNYPTPPPSSFKTHTPPQYHPVHQASEAPGPYAPNYRPYTPQPSYRPTYEPQYQAQSYYQSPSPSYNTYYKTPSYYTSVPHYHRPPTNELLELMSPLKKEDAMLPPSSSTHSNSLYGVLMPLMLLGLGIPALGFVYTFLSRRRSLDANAALPSPEDLDYYTRLLVSGVRCFQRPADCRKLE